MWRLCSKVYFIGNSFWKFYEVRSERGDFNFCGKWSSRVLPLTLLDAGGGSHEPPLGVISHHSVGDAPTNPKFLDFSQFDPYFHLVKSFFTFFCFFCRKITVKNFFRPKKTQFFHKNGKKHIFLANIGIFCFKYVISMLWEIFWGALHVCRSKIGDVENSFHVRQIFESLRPRGCSWRGYAT